MPDPIPCPFDRCSIVIKPVPSGDAFSVPGHEFGGEGLSGLCPASFQRLPIEARVIEYMAETARAMDERLAAKPKRAATERVEHSLAPHPAKQPSAWFRRSIGSSPRHNPPLAGGPVLHLVDDEKPTSPRLPLRFGPTTGEGMASVADTQAAIQASNEAIARAMELLRAATEAFAEGQALIDQVRAGTSAELGGPALVQAIDLCQNAFVRGHGAIEANSTYARGL